MKIKSLLIIAVIATAIFGFGTFANAQVDDTVDTDTSVLIAQLQAQIAELLQQIAVLKAQQGGTTTAWCHTFTDYLFVGKSGNEVFNLRLALGKENLGVRFYAGEGGDEFDETIAAAVVAFQTKYGITPTGTVGPKTRAKLNALYGCVTQPTCVEEGGIVYLGPISANIRECCSGLVTKDLEGPISSGGALTCVKPSACTPNWTCGWGSCVNGYKSHVIVDSNNCGLSSTTANIACTAEAQACMPSTTPSIAVTSPNGGENWKLGETKTVRYAVSSIGPSGTCVDVFAVDVNGNKLPLKLGSYIGSTKDTGISFLLQNSNGGTSITSGNYKIQLDAYYCAETNSAPITSAQSNTFTISSASTTPSITVTSPNGGTCTIGQVCNITWNSTQVANVGIEVFDMREGAGRNSSLTVATSVPASPGLYSWTIPTQIPTDSNGVPLITMPGNRYQIQIVDKNNPNTIQGYSNYFTISSASTTPSITVTSPNNGTENWKIGETHNITWTSANLSSSATANVYLLNSAKQRIDIASYVPVLPGSYSWTLPTTLATGQYKMVVSYSYDYAFYDISDNYFTISAQTSISTPPTSPDTTFAFGEAGAGWLPITGDWDGNGTITTALYNPASSGFYIKNSNTSGVADKAFGFGEPGKNWIPISGKWLRGATSTAVGVYDPIASSFYLTNSNVSGYANITFAFGSPGAGWLPIAGDWDGDGVTTAGLYDSSSSTFYLRNSNTSGSADLTFGFGQSGWKPIAGDWNGDGIDTIGVYDSNSGTIYLRNTNTSGYADITFTSVAGVKLIAGDWDGDGTDTIGLYNPSTSVFTLKGSNTTAMLIDKTASLASIGDAIKNILRQLKLAQ